ncbi:MAG: PIG-L family deacetylase [Chloroflexi bacterium]|nr:PIG-L family deacetylase [Chloroflexota bacterium]
MADEEAYEARSVLVVVAHPDDAEFMASGTVAKWAREGKEINYVLCTAGDKGTSDQSLAPAELAEIRRIEQRDACDRLGVKALVFLGYEDGVLVNSLGLRKDIVRQIRRFRPDVVICQDPTTRWSAQGYLNHPDHRAAGDATLDSVYPSARDPHVFPDLLAEGLQPHKVREVYVGGSNSADVWIDVSDTIGDKVNALRAHVSQVGTGVRPGWDLDEVIRERAAKIAEGHDMKYAEAYKYFHLR